MSSVIDNADSIRYSKDGRQFYLDSTTQTIVIKNGVNGSSTAFRPNNWSDYVNTKIPARTVPY